MLKPQTPTTNYEPVPTGTHLAILYSIIDLGHQEVEWKGEKKSVPKIRLTWELPNELKEFEGKEKPLVIGGQYTNSMGSKANLRPIIEGMIGVGLRDDEAANFDIQNFKELLGKPCLLTVVHAESKGKTYANVSTVSPLMKGMTVPKQFNENVIYELGTSSEQDLAKLPEFMRKQIMKSAEMTRNNGGEIEYPVEEVNPADIPF